MQDERYPERTMRRFWEKIANEPKPDVCWIWAASLTGGGYGQIWDSVDRKRVDAHRLAYLALVGPIPDGLHLDHLCRNRACVNPAHLEPVTRAENLRRGVGFAGENARKTHCVNGHPLAGGNLYVDPRGRRQCKECRRAALSRRLRKKGVPRRLYSQGGRPARTDAEDRIGDPVHEPITTLPAIHGLGPFGGE